MSYFNDALSDFTHDVASGGAIRHLVERGYTTDQILKMLDYPTPRARVEQTVFRYLTDKKILISDLPDSQDKMTRIDLKVSDSAILFRKLQDLTHLNGAPGYLACPYGLIYRDREARLASMLSCLTVREKEYILGIPWEMKMMYHRLDIRMTQIGVELAINSNREQSFYFLNSKIILAAGKNISVS